MEIRLARPLPGNVSSGVPERSMSRAVVWAEKTGVSRKRSHARFSRMCSSCKTDQRQHADSTVNEAKRLSVSPFLCHSPFCSSFILHLFSFALPALILCVVYCLHLFCLCFPIFLSFPHRFLADFFFTSYKWKFSREDQLLLFDAL